MYMTETNFGRKGEKIIDWSGSFPRLVECKGGWVSTCTGSKAECEADAQVNRNWGFKTRIVLL